MPKAPHKIRTRLHLTQAELGEHLGVPATQISKWERGWEEMPASLAVELAIQYGLNTSEVLQSNLSDLEHPPRDYAAAEPDDLYGTAKFTFVSGHVIEFPIDKVSRQSLLRQLDARSFLDSTKAPGSPWLNFEALDDRICFCRLRGIAELELISDDIEAAPPFAHPEVYRALLALGPDPGRWPSEFGPRLRQALDEHLEGFDSSDDAWEAVSSARLLFRNGREMAVPCDDADTAAAYFALDLSCSEIPSLAYLPIHSPRDYDRARFVNLDELDVLTLPREAYLRAVWIDED